MAMQQKRANSASPLRPHPSARLAGMDEPRAPELSGKSVEFLTRKSGRDLIDRQPVSTGAPSARLSVRGSLSRHVHRWISTGPLLDDLVVKTKASRRTDGN